MKKILIPLAALIVFLVACAPQAGVPDTTPLNTEEHIQSETAPTNTPAPLEFTDDLGRTILLEDYPQQIVSLAPSITETIFVLGEGHRMVGRDDFSTYPPAAQDIPSFGSLYSGLPAETILAMEPDLIIAAEIISPETVTAMEELGLTVYWQANPATFEELYENIFNLATLMGAEVKADLVIKDLIARVDLVAETVVNAVSTPLVFYELDATDPSNPYTTGAGTFTDTIITTAGGVNLGASLEGAYAQIGSETVIDQNPDFILLGDAEFGITPESVAARAGWDAIAAVQNGNVIGVDPNLFSVPGPRLVDGLELTAAILHPDLFE